MATIQIRRGVFASLPTLAEGEMYYATDTDQLFIGDPSGNVEIGAGGGGSWTWQGTWASGVYAVDDVVEHNGSSWIAVAPITTEEPGVDPEWELVAEKGDTGATGSTGPAGASGADLAGNLLANGSFRVAQRGTGPFTSATTPANNDDRILIDTRRLLSDGNDVVDVSRTIDAAGLNELALDVETANKKFGVISWVESKNVKEGQTYSLQVRVRATGGGTHFGTVKAAILCFNGTADSVGGSPVTAWGADGVNPTLSAGFTFMSVTSTALTPAATATLTLEGITDSTGAHNIGVMVWNDDTTTTVGDFLYLANAKLEVGAACSTFEQAPYSDDLARCQRYFFALGGSTNRLPATGRADLTNAVFWTYPLGHEMRVAPTLAIVGTGTLQMNDGSVQVNVSSILTNFSATQCIAANFTMAASTFTLYRTCFAAFTDATTFLQASAEL